MDPIDTAEYLAIAAAVLEVPGEQLLHVTRVAEAESALAAPFASYGGIEFYEGVATKAAILCSRLIRNHPLPDGNKRAAVLTMLTFIERNGHGWNPPTQDVLASTIEAVADRSLSEADFIEWVNAHVT